MCTRSQHCLTSGPYPALANVSSPVQVLLPAEQGEALPGEIHHRLILQLRRVPYRPTLCNRGEMAQVFPGPVIRSSLL